MVQGERRLTSLAGHIGLLANGEIYLFTGAVSSGAQDLYAHRVLSMSELRDQWPAHPWPEDFDRFQDQLFVAEATNSVPPAEYASGARVMLACSSKLASSLSLQDAEVLET